MILDVKEAPPVKEVKFKDAKPSEWIESLPLDFFESGICRSDEHTYCGAGLIAEFYGFDWQGLHGKNVARFPVKRDDMSPEEIINSVAFYRIMDEAMMFVGLKTGSRFPMGKFDTICVREGKQAAKEFTVTWLRERGL